MSLTNRVSLFFLAALALVLAGFSLLVYTPASWHLDAQEGERLDAAIGTLVASIEIHPGDVEWEPLERRVTLGEDPAPDQIRWAIHGLDGRLIDCSANLEQPGTARLAERQDWLALVRRVRAGKFEAEPLDGRDSAARGPLTTGFPAGEWPESVCLPRDRTFHFTGDASHQLRTPLAGLLTSVDVALRQERSSAEYQRVLQVVRRRGGQLQQILESLLFLARADTDSTPPDTRVIDLGAWCRCWLANWAEHSRAGDIVFQAGAGEFAARIHPSLFGQVLDNLLDNACKYSAVGTPIVVSIEAGAGEVTLAVTDRGCGISSDELHLVFQPFYRSSQARWTGTPGVGLGLTIVQRLTAILGGKLDVESELGQGSRFCVSLPRAPSASTTALTETAGVVGCPG